MRIVNRRVQSHGGDLVQRLPYIGVLPSDRSLSLTDVISCPIKAVSRHKVSEFRMWGNLQGSYFSPRPLELWCRTRPAYRLLFLNFPPETAETRPAADLLGTAVAAVAAVAMLLLLLLLPWRCCFKPIHDVLTWVCVVLGFYELMRPSWISWDHFCNLWLLVSSLMEVIPFDEAFSWTGVWSYSNEWI